MGAFAPRVRRAIEGAADCHRARRWIGALGLLVVLLAATSAPMAPLFDPDEGYYPATAAETLRSGPFWDLHFNGAPRWDKPVLSYALIEGAFEVFGESASAARLPSALEGAALVVIVGLLVTQLSSARAGTMSALVVATTAGVSIFSKVAHPEIAVVLSVVTTELLVSVWFTSANHGVRRRVALAAGVSIAYGLLAKGPIAVVLPLLAVVSVLPFVEFAHVTVRTATEDAAIAGGVAAALASPWYLAMTARHGLPFLQEAVWQQNVGRYAAASYGHRANAFSLVLPTLVGILPWTAALPEAVRRIRRHNTARREVLRAVMLASAASAFAFYSLSRSKLPSYALVCVPPLGVLVGLLLDEDFDRNAAMTTTARRTAALLGLATVALVAAPLVADKFLTMRQLLGAIRPSTDDLGALLPAMTMPLATMTGMAALALVIMRAPQRRVAAIAAVGALAPILLLAGSRPVLTAMYPWESVGPHIAAQPAPVWLLGRRAPSLTFYAKQPIAIASHLQALEADVGRARAGWLVLTRDEWAQAVAVGALEHKQVTLVAERGRMVLVWFAEPPATLP